MNIPASPSTESALIARLLIEPSEIQGLDGRLRPEDFYNRDYRDAYEAMLDLFHEGRPVDLLTIRETANRDLDLPAPDFSGSQQAPASEYAEMIRNLSLRRMVMEEADGVHAAAKKGEFNRVDEHCAVIAELTSQAGRDRGLGLIDLERFQTVPPPPLLGMLSPEGTTVLYGEGGDGKGWIATSIIRDLLKLGTKSLILDFENHPTEWAYRLNRLGVPVRKVLYVEPSGTMDRWADARAERLVKIEDIGFIVVDSATYATNDSDDPYSPRAAMLYKRARAKLGNLPTLLLAHTPKSSDTIYGSVFFRNEARIVWRLTKVGEQRQRQLECKKDNVYGLEGKRLIVEFDEQDGILNLHPWGQPWAVQKVTSGV